MIPRVARSLALVALAELAACEPPVAPVRPPVTPTTPAVPPPTALPTSAPRDPIG